MITSRGISRHMSPMDIETSCISFKKDQMLSMLIFLYRFFILFALKKPYPTRAMKKRLYPCRVFGMQYTVVIPPEN